MGVDAVQLGGFLKAGETAVAGLEESLHAVQRPAVRQEHVTAHGAEAVHEPLLWT